MKLLCSNFYIFNVEVFTKSIQHRLSVNYRIFITIPTITCNFLANAGMEQMCVPGAASTLYGV